MIARIIALGAILSVVALGPALADDIGGEDIVIPTVVETVIVETPVTAPPPPYVSIESRSIAAGIGFSWGGGNLSFEGRSYPFSAKGVSLGDLGASKLVGMGDVENLEQISDFEGTYLAVEAGAAAGVGGTALTMRNENGVVITVRGSLSGARLTLGAEGIRIALK